MPITEQVYKVLYEDKDPLGAVKELMSRDLKEEWEVSFFRQSE
jgi:glycerol-3-phosphate dehydrogenase (NAD(P)+)